MVVNRKNSLKRKSSVELIITCPASRDISIAFCGWYCFTGEEKLLNSFAASLASACFLASEYIALYEELTVDETFAIPLHQYLDFYADWLLPRQAKRGPKMDARVSKRLRNKAIYGALSQKILHLAKSCLTLAQSSTWAVRGHTKDLY